MRVGMCDVTNPGSMRVVGPHGLFRPPRAGTRTRWSPPYRPHRCSGPPPSARSRAADSLGGAGLRSDHNQHTQYQVSRCITFPAHLQDGRHFSCFVVEWSGACSSGLTCRSARRASSGSSGMATGSSFSGFGCAGTDTTVRPSCPTMGVGTLSDLLVEHRGIGPLGRSVQGQRRSTRRAP
jgi:hypothetical protein